MTNTAIIVAGGSGLRMGQCIPKQFLLLSGKPILMHTIESFYNFDATMQIIVVLPEAQIGFWESLCDKHGFDVAHQIACGGQARFQSVQNGLALANRGALIGVHDGVRPFAALETLQRCYQAAKEKGNAVPVTDSVESIRQMTATGSCSVNRNDYKMVQTPQVFSWDQITKAYQTPFDPTFTDDASVVEKAGFHIHLVEGNRENMKITTPLDLLMGEALLNRKH